MLRFAFVTTICFANDAHAYAPIKWMKFPARGLVLMPGDFSGNMRGLAPPSQLFVRDPPKSITPDTVPYFTTKPDKTITWGDSWCVEASGDKIGNPVIINYCNGGPSQKWNWVADDHGRSMIQLTDSNMCLDVVDKEGSVNGAPIELRECQNRVTEAWEFEESVSQRHPLSFDIRHVLLLSTLVGIGMLSIGAWFARRQTKAQIVSMRQGGSPMISEQAHLSDPYSNAQHGSRTSAPVVMMAKDKKSKFIEIFLNETVPNLGEGGEVVSIKHSYAENIIIPKGLGIKATPALVSKWQANLKAKADKLAAEEKVKAEAAKAELDAAKETAETLQMRFGGGTGVEGLFIKEKANPDGELYGKVSVSDLVDDIKMLLPGISIDKKAVTVPDIKHVGETTFTVSLHKDVVVTLKLVVEPENQ